MRMYMRPKRTALNTVVAVEGDIDENMRRIERQDRGGGDEITASGSIPNDVLSSMPDVDVEEQKMLMAALTGQAYDGEIPDFTNVDPQISRPLSPGAAARQLLREEQDIAFKESLEMDKEKQRQEEMAKIEQMEREESEKIEKRLMMEKIQQKKESLVAEPAADDPDALSFAIRLPSGLRLKRRFSKVDSIGSLFDFLDVEGAPELKPGSYELVSNYPRKVYSCQGQDESHSTTLEELGFSAQEALFVQSHS
jgi:hypothetical protein